MLLNNFTLLYVEDDESVVESMKDLLEGEVKELFIAHNGKEGLELFKEKNPDIVLTDVNMPIMDGIMMSTEIKKINNNKPIAILTAFNEPDYLKKAVNIGIDKYILKPVTDLDNFYDALNDIAKVLQADRDLKKHEKMLEIQSKTAAMGEMLGNIAHQWRQPLSVITTCASSLKLNKELEALTDENFNESIDAIMKSSEYLSQTIEDFRNFFIDQHSSKQEFNLKDALLSVISLIKDSYKMNSIEVVQDCDDILISQNRNQLEQALVNIFNNSKDAIVQNGIDSDYRLIFISLKKEDNYALLSLRDSGGGIKEELFEKIFEPYFTTKHQFHGTGIGLYMTQQIIAKNFNGSIEVGNCEYEYKGRKLKGAEFKIKIPLN